ncbi:ABC transporter permease, partial [Candidatus Frankia alpina]
MAVSTADHAVVADPGVALAAAKARRAAGRALVILARSFAIFAPVFLVATFLTFALRAASGLSPATLQLGESATPDAVAR